MASVTFPSGFSHDEPRRLRRGSFSWRRFRPLLLAIAAFCVGLLAAELLLRALENYYEQPVARLFAVEGPFAPGTSLGGRTINTLGYWDDEFSPTPTVGKFRIALLGGRVTLGGVGGTNMADRLENLLPGVEVQHFGQPEGNPGEYAARLRRDVLRFQPQYVLICLSPADEVASTAEPPRVAEVRLVQLSKRLAGAARPESERPTFDSMATGRDYEAYVRGRIGTAAVCRATANESLERRWRAAQTELERIVRRCRQREIGVGVVLAPSEFQLSSTLAEALRRRAGLSPQEFDVDLPQRRWSALVDHLQLPALDLLPAFRAADTVLFEPSSPDWNERGGALAAETTARWLRPTSSHAVAGRTTP